MPRPLPTLDRAAPRRVCLKGTASCLWCCAAFLWGASLLASRSYAQVERTAPGARPLNITDLLAKRHFAFGSGIALSPDGRWVAYAVGAAKPRDGAEYLVYDSTGAPSGLGRLKLFATDTRTRQTVTISSDVGVDWAPAWSPDSRYLAFCSTRNGIAQLWIWERRTGALRRAANETVLVSTIPARPPRWMPDGRHVLVKVLPRGLMLSEFLTEAAKPPRPVGGNRFSGAGIQGATVTAYVSPASSVIVSHRTPADTNAAHRDYSTKIDRGDLALIDVETGSVRRLTQGTHPSWYMPSPDGKMVAFAENRGLRGGNNWRRLLDLYVLSVRDSVARLIAPRLQQQVPRISWSPTSRWLAYTQFGQGVDGDVHVAPATGGPTRNISHGPHASFNFLRDHALGMGFVPLWNRDGTAVFLLASDTLWRATLQDSTAHPIATLPGHELLEIVALIDGRYWSPGDGGSIYVKIRDLKTYGMGYAQIDLERGRVTRRFTEPKTYGHLEASSLLGDAAPNGTQFAYVAEDGSHPPRSLGERFRTRHAPTTLAGEPTARCVYAGRQSGCEVAWP